MLPTRQVSPTSRGRQGEVARGEWANGAESGVTLRTAQRLLADDLNPTASTGEVIAKALEVNIRIERK